MKHKAGFKTIRNMWSMHDFCFESHLYVSRLVSNVCYICLLFPIYIISNACFLSTHCPQMLWIFIRSIANYIKIISLEFFNDYRGMVHIICKLKTFEWIARWKNSCQEFAFRMVSRLMAHFRHFSCRQLNAVIKMSQIIWFIDYDSS